jgi:hypothetical protein
METIRRKLERDILPWLESAERLASWTPFRVYSVYFWLGEIFVLLAGLGFSHPAFRLLAPLAPEKAGAAAGEPIIAGLGEGVMFWLAVSGLVAWGVLKAYVVRHDLEKRCSLLKSSIKQFRQFRMQLGKVLEGKNPTDELTQLQESINETVNRMYGEDAWPWPRGVAPGIEAEVACELERYLRQYGDSWTSVPKAISTQQKVRPDYG